MKNKETNLVKFKLQEPICKDELCDLAIDNIDQSMQTIRNNYYFLRQEVGQREAEKDLFGMIDYLLECHSERNK
jgi:hypothetical protein